MRAFPARTEPLGARLCRAAAHGRRSSPHTVVPYDPITHMITNDSPAEVASTRVVPPTMSESERPKPASAGAAAHHESGPEQLEAVVEAEDAALPAKAPGKTSRSTSLAPREHRRSQRLPVRPEFAPKIQFRIGERVGILPGTKRGKHKRFVEQARRHLEPDSLSAQFQFADAMHAHRKARLYAEASDRYIYDIVKKLYFASVAIRPLR